MILRLIKLEYPSWKGIAIFYAIVIAFVFSAAIFAHITISVSVMALLFLLGTRAFGRNTMFESALPIPGRDIFCARLLASLLAAWPLLIAVIAAIPFSRAAAKPQMAAAVI